jgi:hypothetical protein
VLAFDYAGGFNGVYGYPVQNGNPSYNIAGPRPADGFPGFSTTNMAANFSTNNGTNSLITVPAWNLNTNTVTITAWLYPSGPQPRHAGVVFCRAGGTIAGMYYSDRPDASGNYTLGYNWNDVPNTYTWISGLKAPTNRWSYTALVITPTNAIIYLMHSSALFSETNVNAHANAPFGGNTLIGNDSFNTAARAFNGVIDDVSVFNRSLSLDDLLNLYAAGSGLRASAPPDLLIQWAGSNLQVIWTNGILPWRRTTTGILLEASNLMGPWATNTAASPYTVPQGEPQKFYRIQFPLVLQPHVVGDWWQVAGDPDLGDLTTADQQPVDFGVWQATDGTWQLWSCIRKTKESGQRRLFYRWEGAKLTDANWNPMGIAMRADTNYGETEGGLQAPYVFRQDGNYEMFYGGWGSICRAQSADGKAFERRLTADGQSTVFVGEYHARDPMVLRIGDLWYCYYSAHPDGKGAVYCRTSRNLREWSEASIVGKGGQAGERGGSWECPFVVELQPGDFYLFSTQKYGTEAKTSVYFSRDPMDFGVDHDEGHFVCTLPVAAPEIFQYNGEWFIAALLPSLKGIQISHLTWTK